MAEKTVIDYIIRRRNTTLVFDLNATIGMIQN